MHAGGVPPSVFLHARLASPLADLGGVLAIVLGADTIEQLPGRGTHGEAFAAENGRRGEQAPGGRVGAPPRPATPGESTRERRGSRGAPPPCLPPRIGRSTRRSRHRRPRGTE